jgi:hypothetical protein
LSSGTERRHGSASPEEEEGLGVGVIHKGFQQKRKGIVYEKESDVYRSIGGDVGSGVRRFRMDG